MRRFVLQRDTDVTGVSGTGVVAEGVEFSDGTAALRWLGPNPTSVVFHDHGLESVEAVHGHGGATQIVFLDDHERTLYRDNDSGEFTSKADVAARPDHTSTEHRR